MIIGKKDSHPTYIFLKKKLNWIYLISTNHLHHFNKLLIYLQQLGQLKFYIYYLYHIKRDNKKTLLRQYLCEVFTCFVLLFIIIYTTYATPNVVTLYPIVLTLSRESGKIVLFYQVHVNVLKSVCVEYTIYLLTRQDNFAINSIKLMPQLIYFTNLICLQNLILKFKWII